MICYFKVKKKLLSKLWVHKQRRAFIIYVLSVNLPYLPEFVIFCVYDVVH